MSETESFEHDSLLQALHNAERLLDEEKHEEARLALLGIQARAAKLNVRSAYLAWKLAIVFDCLGDGVKAASYAELAVKGDPLALPFRGSMMTIVSRMRRTLADPQTDLAQDWIGTMYATLQHLGEADEGCHLAFAKNRIVKGDLAHALRVLQALTLLSPNFPAGWEALASVAKKLGNEELAQNAAQQLDFARASPRFDEPSAKA